MGRTPENTKPQPILSGWKDIANYLGLGVRTVQRYEYSLRLPVRRPAGKPGGSVLATKAELDAWANAKPLKAAFSFACPKSDSLIFVRLQESMNKMGRLKDQMRELRNDLTVSVDILRSSIRLMHEVINEPHAPGNRRWTN